MPTPAELRRVGIEREDRKFFLVDGHEPHSQRQITTGLALRAAIGVVRETVELAQQASHLSALEPELLGAREAADFYVFPPHFLFIEVARAHRVQSNMPEVHNYSRRGDSVPKIHIGAQVAIHHIGLALHNPRDSQVYLATAMPDTRQTAPVVLGVSVGELDELHFRSTATQNPQELSLIDPRLLLMPPSRLPNLAA